MFGWLFKNAIQDPHEQGDSNPQFAPTAPPPPCRCTECQKARAFHLQDIGLMPGVAPRTRRDVDVTHAYDPTVYEG